jgi:hypothetical protein
VRRLASQGVFLVKSKYSVTSYLFLYATLVLRFTYINLRRILVGKLCYIKIIYFLRNYYVQRIPQIHILNFNHEYLITSHSHVTTVMLPCCHCAALLMPPPPLCCHCYLHVAMLLPLPCHHHYAVAAATLLAPPRCCHQAAATTTATTPLPPQPLLPSCHCCCKAATIAIIYIVR